MNVDKYIFIVCLCKLLGLIVKIDIGTFSSVEKKLWSGGYISEGLWKKREDIDRLQMKWYRHIGSL